LPFSSILPTPKS